MSDYLETSIEKFIFKVATDRFYTPEGLWIKYKDDVIQLGVTDFFQQRNGDAAFVNLQPMGTLIKLNGEIASVETIKVNLSLASPVTGKIINVNKNVEAKPELINQDPYGEGWFYEVSADNWSDESKQLLSPEQYFVIMRKEAEEEVKRNE